MSPKKESIVEYHLENIRKGNLPPLSDKEKRRYQEYFISIGCKPPERTSIRAMRVLMRNR
jgi:hypothetical protein